MVFLMLTKTGRDYDITVNYNIVLIQGQLLKVRKAVMQFSFELPEKTHIRTSLPMLSKSDVTKETFEFLKILRIQ